LINYLQPFQVQTKAVWLGCYNHLQKINIEEFIVAAEGSGLLPNGKKTDAESAAAMWEEANCNLWQQQIILRHLAFYFGQRLTVP
jgi:hypothetical protein